MRIFLPALVSTLGGSGSASSSNGIGTAASFWSPATISWDAVSNSLFITESSLRLRNLQLPSGMSMVFKLWV
jgi:hypothetical protein